MEKLSVQLCAILVAISLGGHHRDYFSLKARQSGRILNGLGELLSEGHSDIGDSGKQTTHIGHDFGIGFGLADPPFSHLGVSGWALLIRSYEYSSHESSISEIIYHKEMEVSLAGKKVGLK